MNRSLFIRNGYIFSYSAMTRMQKFRKINSYYKIMNRSLFIRNGYIFFYSAITRKQKFVKINTIKL